MSNVARDWNFQILPLRIQRAFTDVRIGYNYPEARRVRDLARKIEALKGIY